MLNQERLDAIHLHKKPRGQVVVGTFFLGPNYRFPFRKTEIVLEGRENIPPNGGCIFVMNHTDRYNYWPFQYQLWKEGIGFTATWVKGKYYENRLVGWFLDSCNNIPVPSKGYVLTKDFQLTHGRIPTDAEYAALKGLIDEKLTVAEAISQGGSAVEALLVKEWPDSADGNYRASLENRFTRMMQKVVELNIEALKMGLNLLIFPQGTRSVRLTRGHIGAAQMAAFARASVIPVGCNGSDRCYRGNLPFSKGGKIVYRIGKPLSWDRELKPFAIDEPFVPFMSSADRFQSRFQAATDLFMEKINELLDPPYRRRDGTALTQGAKRFV